MKYVTLFIHILVFLLLSTHVLQIEGIKHLEISETVILPTGKGAEGLNMETCYCVSTASKEKLTRLPMEASATSRKIKEDMKKR